MMKMSIEIAKLHVLVLVVLSSCLCKTRLHLSTERPLDRCC